MAEILKHKLIMVSSTANNNKFYELYLDGDTVIAKYGRVGSSGQVRSYPGGERMLQRKFAEKSRKGYVSVRSLDGEAPSTGSTRPTIAPIAAGINIGQDDDVTTLINTLVSANKHAIETTSGGRITVSEDGIVRTPLGIVTTDALDDAQKILDSIYRTHTARSADVDTYLTLIPQKLSKVSDFVSTLESDAGYIAQNDLLDQLRTSSSLYAERVSASLNDPEDTVVTNPFRYKIEKASQEEYELCEKKFSHGAKSVHSSSRMSLKKVYRVIDTDAALTAWEQRKETSKNWSRMLWHGTMTENLLSILHTGFFVPKLSGSGIHIAGRMFGDGVYFATSSTKSLNYSAGSWAGRRYSTAFMLLSDVVTGHEYRTTASTDRRSAVRDSRGGDYDSLFVKANTCSVINDEIVVWDTDRIKISYLCEFGS